MNLISFPNHCGGFDISLFPTLDETQRLRLLHIRNDERVRRWMYTRHLISPQEHQAFFKTLATEETALHFALSREGTVLGAFNFQRLNRLQSHTYFGMYADPDAPVPGLGVAIDKIATHFAFDILDLHALRLEVIASNAGVIAMHRRMGFAEEGRLREYVRTDQGWEDVLIMGKLRGNPHE